MYVLLASKQLIPNLTPDSHNAVTPECKPRFTTLVRPLMAFISNFSESLIHSLSALIMNYDYGSGFSLKAKLYSFGNWVGVRQSLRWRESPLPTLTQEVSWKAETTVLSDKFIFIPVDVERSGSGFAQTFVPQNRNLQKVHLALDCVSHISVT